MSHPQAIVRIVPRGGARTARQIRDQLKYLSRKGALDLQRSERYQSVLLPYNRIDEFAHSWAEQTGNYQAGQSAAESDQDLTTHIIVSFPSGTDASQAHAAGRAWTETMFGSGYNGGSFDYITAFHVDRQHPHLHIVVNRRALEGHWLKISRRHPHHNYDNMRAVLVDAAYDHGIELDATRRADRGIMERPITYAEFRRRQRVAEAVAIRPEPESDIPVSPRAPLEPTSLERDSGGQMAEAPQAARGTGVGWAIQTSRSTAEMVDRANLGDIVGPIQAQNANPGPSHVGGFELQRGTRRRRELDEVQPNSLERPRQRRRFAPSIIETRAQRAAREQRESEERVAEAIAFRPEPEPDIPVSLRGPLEPTNLERDGEVGTANAPQAARGPGAIQTSRSAAEMVHRTNPGDIAQDTDPAPSDVFGFELQRETRRRRGRELEGDELQVTSLERPRQRRRFAPSIIETRAQRAAREQRESEESARRHRRREPEPEDMDPNQPLRLRSGRVIVRSHDDERGGSR